MAPEEVVEETAEELVVAAMVLVSVAEVVASYQVVVPLDKAHTLDLSLHQDLFQRTQFHKDLLLETKLLTSSLSLLAVQRGHLQEGYRSTQAAQAYPSSLVNHEVHLEESPHIQKKKELEKKEHLVVETEDQPNQSEQVFQVSDQKQSVEPIPGGIL